MDDNKKRGDDTVGEELSAFGERVKGSAKDAAGSVTGNRALEREGEREKAEGRARGLGAFLIASPARSLLHTYSLYVSGRSNMQTVCRTHLEAKG